METTPGEQPKKAFVYLPLEIVIPDYGSELTDMVLALENFRGDVPAITTPLAIFSEIKTIFHMLESVGSTRIEGNRTALSEYVDTKLDGKTDRRPTIVEINNIERALQFVDSNISSSKIDRAFISEIHKTVVDGLPLPPKGEGSSSPGAYRDKEVKLERSDLVVSPVVSVVEHMEELFAFINNPAAAKYDLLKTAIAHHRFVKIHPFDNGNGRTVRLLTYAMLLKYGFGDSEYRLINPAAVFLEDRNKYVAALSRADKGEKEDILAWCFYMLSGLKRELEKIKRLGDYEYLKAKILLPAVQSSFDRQMLKPFESEILKIAIEKKAIKNGDIRKTHSGKGMVAVSKSLAELRKSEILVPIPSDKRKYRISLFSKFLFRDVVDALKREGFWPAED